jgi:hypothetical protein
LALKLLTQTIHREGELSYVIDGEFHCGAAAAVQHGILQMRYEVTVECVPDLDTRGFIFDQAALDGYFIGLSGQTSPFSCEKLNQFLGVKFLQWLKRENPGCTPISVKCKISARPYTAWFEVLYEDRELRASLLRV